MLDESYDFCLFFSKVKIVNKELKQFMKYFKNAASQLAY